MGRHLRWKPKEFFISAKFEDEFLVRRYGQSHWRVRVVRKVHSHGVQLFLALLLCLDVLALIAELIISSYFPTCETTLQFCSAELEGSGTGGGGGAHRALAEATCRATCLEHPHWTHSVHLFLFAVSIIILIIFELELLMLLVTVKKLFFRNFYYVFDFVVVSVALVLESIFFAASSSSQSEELGGLLILLRLWRLVRLGHAIGTDVHEYEHHKISALEKRVGELEAEVARLKPPSSPNEDVASLAAGSGLPSSHEGGQAGNGTVSASKVVLS